MATKINKGDKVTRLSDPAKVNVYVVTGINNEKQTLRAKRILPTEADSSQEFKISAVERVEEVPAEPKEKPQGTRYRIPSLLHELMLADEQMSGIVHSSIGSAKAVQGGYVFTLPEEQRKPAADRLKHLIEFWGESFAQARGKKAGALSSGRALLKKLQGE